MTKISSLISYGIFIVLISYVIFLIIDFTGINYNPRLFNEDLCSYHTGIIGAEDIVNYNGIPLISSDDRPKLMMQSDKYGVLKTPSGSIYTIIPSNDNNQNIIFQSIDLIDFPKDILFHPHGLSLHGNKLFVLNHAWEKGGERVEIFDIKTNDNNKLSLIYNNSVVFSDDFMGMFNDLLVLNQKEFFITTLTNTVHSPKGTNLPETFWKDQIRLLRNIFLRETYVYYVNIDLTRKNPLNFIRKESQTSDRMNNGISSNGKNLILVGNTMDKRVSVYRYEENKQNKQQNYDHLIFLRTIDVGDHVDNIDYDPETKSFYLGVFPRLIDFVKIENMIKEHGKILHNDDLKGGVSRIREEEKVDRMKAEMIYFQKDLGPVSVACKFQDSLILGTAFGEGISICKSSNL